MLRAKIVQGIGYYSISIAMKDYVDGVSVAVVLSMVVDTRFFIFDIENLENTDRILLVDCSVAGMGYCSDVIMVIASNDNVSSGSYSNYFVI